MLLKQITVLAFLMFHNFGATKEKALHLKFSVLAFWGQRSERDPDLKVCDGWYSTIACLQENVSVGMKRVKTKVFI